jgi:hypothetical protein
MIWGAIKRTYTSEWIATMIGLVVAGVVFALGFDAAAVPAGLTLGVGAFLVLAVYRYRHGRL